MEDIKELITIARKLFLEERLVTIDKIKKKKERYLTPFSS